MNIEENRLNTFRDWPSSAEVEPIRIAKAGFYYTGQGLEVQCFSCDCKISEWNYGDQVMLRHRLMNPLCAFVLDPNLANNVSLVLPREASGSASHQESPIHSNVDLPPTETEYDIGVTGDDIMYRNNALRLLSFVNWPQDLPVPANHVAQAGMYHIGGGRVRCCWCAGELNGADLGVDPSDAHERMYGNCRNSMNGVLNLSSSDFNQSPSQTPESTGGSVTEGIMHNESLLQSKSCRGLGIISVVDGARHPDKSTHSARLQTYSFWPPGKVQTPRQLTEAGFFFTGLEDRVRCFFCDGGLGSWEPDDEPWQEHARWFPQCAYVLLIKGKDFVKKCKDPSIRMAEREKKYKFRRPTFPVDERQVNEIMESPVAMAALDVGMDAARVRAAVVRRLRCSGVGFNNAESLLDAVLQQQLSEESWSARPSRSPMAMIQNIVNGVRIPLEPPTVPQDEEQHLTLPQNEVEPSISPQNEIELLAQELVPEVTPPVEEVCDQVQINAFYRSQTEARQKRLEEENRQLKESRLCKVCMDREVGVVFLPCGHLVSCVACSASLAHCPLCRGGIRALVRAYLA